ncbi:hypothetical protein BJ508DRAFT_314424 [Ascobolus immersus RN42]|uniref:Uncharacterized protein n=1 Tax=Ascobolus immersus RN42 TaxID=1160509 RepID=A0A3N4HLR9_ASCIM|nr:hypothetical protein BJ508DRAFT_314424 [Ascobolus immersus RN42]
MPSLSFLLRLCGKPKSRTTTHPISEKTPLPRPASIAQKPITVAASRKSAWPLDEPTAADRTPRVTERPSSSSGDTIDLCKSHSLSPTPAPVEEVITKIESVRPPIQQTPVVPAKEVLYPIDTSPLEDAEVTAQFIALQLKVQSFIQESYIEDCNLRDAEAIIKAIRGYGRHEAFQDVKFPQLLLEAWFWMRMKAAFEKGEMLPAGGLVERVSGELEELTGNLNTNTHLPKRKLLAYQAEQKTKLRELVASVILTLIHWEVQPATFTFIFPTSAGWLEPGKIENIAKRGAMRDSVIDDEEEGRGRFSGGIVVPMLVRRDEMVVSGGVTLVPAWARVQFVTAAEKRWSGTMDMFVREQERGHERGSSW